MSKITFLTGAGASFGSGQVIPYPPPLGRNLYEDLEIFNSSAMNQISSIIGRKNIEDFEGKMHEMWKSKRINGFALNSLFARYFSRFAPNVYDNRFVDLARIIQNNLPFDGVYATLNYDCIAELAASSIRLPVNYNLDTFNPQSFNVLKIHGSCNFINNSMTGPANGLSAGMMENMVDGSGIDIVEPNQVPITLQQRPLGPVMTYYMKNKPSPTNKSILTRIQKKWEEHAAESEKLVLIGINPNPIDSHIWDAILHTKAKIGFVGSSKGFRKLKKLKLKKVPKHLEEHFEDSISEIENFIQ